MLIGQVATISGVSKDTIRLYERRGLIKSEPQVAGSRIYRDFPKETIGLIKEIKQAQLSGLTLSEIGKLIKAWVYETTTNDEKSEILASYLHRTRLRISSLQALEETIIEKMKSLNN